MGELFGLMNLLDSELYDCEEDFLDKFGGGKDGISLEQVQALQVCHNVLLSNFPFIEVSVPGIQSNGDVMIDKDATNHSPDDSQICELKHGRKTQHRCQRHCRSVPVVLLHLVVVLL